VDAFSPAKLSNPSFAAMAFLDDSNLFFSGVLLPGLSSDLSYDGFHVLFGSHDTLLL
jgi:hypothetical protein